MDIVSKVAKGVSGINEYRKQTSIQEYIAISTTPVGLRLARTTEDLRRKSQLKVCRVKRNPRKV